MVVKNLKPVPYEFDRNEEVIALLNKVFSPWQGDIDYFNWKYNTLAIDGCSFPRAWVIKDNDKIIAFNGYMPRKVFSNGKYHWAVQSFDTATDQDYRGHGLFGILQNSVYDEMKRHNITWVYGYGSEIGHKVFTEKMKWKEWGRQRYLMKVLDTKSFMSEKISNPLLSSLASAALFSYGKILSPGQSKAFKIKKIDAFPETAAHLFETLHLKFGMVSARDVQYMNWRSSAPNSKMTILEASGQNNNFCGYAVIRKNEECLDIEDCMAESKSALLSLLSEIEKIAWQNQNKMIRFRVNEKYPMSDIFRRAGYFQSNTFFPVIGRKLIDNDFEINIESLHWTVFDRNE